MTMRNPLKLISEMLNQPLLIMLWIGVLVLANMFALAYWDYALAKWIVGIFLFQGTIMMGLYSYFGYQKILGLAHIFWIPLLIYIVLNLGSYVGNFQTYLLVLLCINAVSVVVDIYDVFTYFKHGSV